MPKTKKTSKRKNSLSLGVRRRLRITSIVLLVLVIAGIGTKELIQSRAETPLQTGIHFHCTQNYTDAQRTAILDKLAAAKVGWVRMEISWTTLEEKGPGLYTQWYLDIVNNCINQANARGIKVLGSVWGTPPWANGGASWNVPPSNPADYGRFMGWASSYFKGRVGAWELWNEPNLDYFFQGHNLATYTAMVKSAYPAIKAVDPTVPVAAGVLSSIDTSLVSNLYAAGIKGYFDVLAIHGYNGALAPETPYTTGGSNVIDHVGAIRSLMLAQSDDKPIWLTETGYSSHSNTSNTPSWAMGVTETEQADYLKRTFQFLSAAHPEVKAAFWYTERNIDTTDIHEANFGVLYIDLTPKPAYTALKEYLSSTAPLPADSTLPLTQITTPSNNAAVSGKVRITAAASDNVGVRSLEIIIDGRTLFTASSTTATISWNTRKTTPGPHTVTAKAIDTSGNVGTTSITVTVQ